MKFLLPILLLFPSQPLFACTVCFSAAGDVRVAFYLTTLFLSLLPLAMIGGFVLWLRKRTQNQAVD